MKLEVIAVQLKSPREPRSVETKRGRDRFGGAENRRTKEL